MNNDDTKKRQVLANLAWHSGDKAFRLLISLVVGLWMARYLGPEQFGAFSYVYTWLGLFTAFAWLGAGDRVTRDLVRKPSDAARLLGSTLLIRSCGSVVAIALAIGAAFCFGKFSPEQLILLLVLCVRLPFAEMPAAISIWYISQTNIRPVIVSRNIGFVLGALARVVGIMGGAGLIVLGATFAMESVLACFVLLLMYRNAGQSLSRWKYDWRHAWAVLTAGLPIIVNTLAITIGTKIDQLILGRMTDMSAVGVYAAALKFSEIWWIVPPMIMQSVAARYIYPQMPSELRALNISRLICAMFLLSLVPCAGVLVFGNQVIDLLLGTSYSGAASVLAIHIFASVFVFIDSVVSQYLLTSDKQVLLVMKSAAIMTLNALFAVLLVPRFGAQGAAASILLAFFFTVVAFPLILPQLGELRRIYLLSLSQVPYLVRSALSVARVRK